MKSNVRKLLKSKIHTFLVVIGVLVQTKLYDETKYLNYLNPRHFIFFSD